MRAFWVYADTGNSAHRELDYLSMPQVETVVSELAARRMRIDPQMHCFTSFLISQLFPSTDGQAYHQPKAASFNVKMRNRLSIWKAITDKHDEETPGEECKGDLPPLQEPEVHQSPGRGVCTMHSMFEWARYSPANDTLQIPVISGE